MIEAAACGTSTDSSLMAAKAAVDHQSPYLKSKARSVSCPAITAVSSATRPSPMKCSGHETTIGSSALWVPGLRRMVFPGLEEQ